MNAKQIHDYRKVLTDLAKKLDRSLAHDQREVMHMDLPDVPSGPMAATSEVLDSGTQEIEVGLMANEEGLLGEVTAALDRIAAGTFGQCESCGKAITKTRLDAVPYARRCIHCAIEAEKA